MLKNWVRGNPTRSGGHLLPPADNTYDLGSVAYSWRNIYADTITYIVASEMTGALTIGVDGTGHDATFYGDTSGNFLLWDADTNQLKLDGTVSTLQIGDFTGATHGTGIALSGTRTGALKVYADDNDTDIGSGYLVRSIWGRTLSTVGSQNAEMVGVQGSVVCSTGSMIHNAGGLLGSLEFRGTSSVTGTAGSNIFAGVLARVGMGTGTLTVGTGAVMAGLAAMMNVQTVVTQTYTGTVAGLYIGQWATTDDWPYGIYIADGTCTIGIQCNGSMVMGSDTSGHDLKVFGDVTGSYLLWDASEEGLTLSQGATDTFIMQLKSSDVDHPFTDFTEADTYLDIFKSESTSGGITFRAYKSSAGSAGYAMNFIGYLGEAADTTKSTSGLGVVILQGAITNASTGRTDVADAGNVVVLQNKTTAIAIFGGGGDLWVGGGITDAGGTPVSGYNTLVNPTTLTLGDRTAATNGIYSFIDTGGATGWSSGNVVAGRFKVDLDGSGTVADATGVWTGLIFDGSFTGVGLTCAINAEVNTVRTDTHPNSILYLQSLPGSSASHATMPFIVFSETATGTGSNVLYEVGHVAAGTTCTAGNKAAKNLVCTADVTGSGGASAGGLRLIVNGTAYWLATYTE